METLIKTYRRNPAVWSLFFIFMILWILPLSVYLFPNSVTAHKHDRGNRSPYGGFLVLSFLYLLINIILAFCTKKGNIYLKVSGYIGFALIVFTAIYADL